MLGRQLSALAIVFCKFYSSFSYRLFGFCLADLPRLDSRYSSLPELYWSGFKLHVLFPPLQPTGVMHLAGIPFNLGMGHDLAFTGILKTGFLYSYLLRRWLTLAASDSASFLFVGSVGPLQMLISKAVLLNSY